MLRVVPNCAWAKRRQCNNYTDSNELVARTAERCPCALGILGAHRKRSAQERIMKITVEPTNEADEDHIRHRAYMLWLEDGQPDGRAEEHWHLARSVAEKKEDVPTAVTVSKGKGK